MRRARHVSSSSDSEQLQLQLKKGKGDYNDLFDDLDADERRRLNQMSDKDREMEVFKLIEQREAMKTREEIKKKLSLGHKKDKKPNVGKKKKATEEKNDESETDSSLQSSEEGETSEDEDQKEENSDTREELDPKHVTRQNSKTAEGDDDEEPNEESELDTHYHRPSELASKQTKQKAMADLLSRRQNKKQAEEKRKQEAQKAALDINEIFGNDDGKSSSSSSSSISSRDSSPDSRSPTPPPKQEIRSKSELMKCRLSRYKLAQFVHAPFFNKTVIGCFVRIGIGQNAGKSVYRVAQIIDVVETAKIYQVENTRTNKGVKLKHGLETRVYRLEYVSNQEFTDTEFLMWYDAMRKNKITLPTVDFVEAKEREIREAVNYKYTDAEINDMVREKSRFKTTPTNYAMEKQNLLRQKDAAEEAEDEKKLKDILSQIEELDARSEKLYSQRNQQLTLASQINQRNRDMMKKSFLGDAAMLNDDLAIQDDPFTRKTSKMRVVAATRSKSSAGNTAPNDGAPIKMQSGTAEVKLTATESLPTSIFRQKYESQQLPKANDLFNAHDIEINIQVKLPQPAASFRAGIDSRNNQESSTSRKLTLDEYKRRKVRNHD